MKMDNYSVKSEVDYTSGHTVHWVGTKTSSGFIYLRKFFAKKDATAYKNKLNKKLKLENPGKIIKSATGWIKATAVKIANGKLYIKRPKK